MNAQELKSIFLQSLATSPVTNVQTLWACAKQYAEARGYIMGGSYASFGDCISVSIKDDDEVKRFTIGLKEVAFARKLHNKRYTKFLIQNHNSKNL